jgi:hypothetical protein
VTPRRLLLLLVMYFMVDFADPLVVSPITAQVEDGEEEVIQVQRVRLKKDSVSEPRASQSVPPVSASRPQPRIAEVPRSLARRAWLTPVRRAVVTVSDATSAPEDH